ncbi:S8 family serine peptidase [bacterium]|nr:S8 family serine peptidase [bacterium]
MVIFWQHPATAQTNTAVGIKKSEEFYIEVPTHDIEDIKNDRAFKTLVQQFGKPTITKILPDIKNGEEYKNYLDKLRHKFPIRAQRMTPQESTPLSKIYNYYHLTFSKPIDTAQADYILSILKHLSKISFVELVPHENLDLAINPGLPGQPQIPSQPITPIPVPGSPQTPNDPFFSSQGTWNQPYTDMWGLNKINMPLAWSYSRGHPDLKIAVIDGGIDYNHPDISNYIWKNNIEENGITGVDDDNNGYIDDVVGYDFESEDNDPMDHYGHGTHVAGTIMAASNNSMGISGIIWQGKIMPLKVCSDSSGSCNSSAKIDALHYAINMGADVANLSLGGYNYSQTEKENFLFARDAGLVVVAATGNDNSDASYHFPSGYPTVIAVGAITPTFQIANFSNYGWKTDILAPGSSILSLNANQSVYGSTHTDKIIPTLLEPSNYLLMSGTSMASPHVAGVVGLLLASNNRLDVDEVLQKIKQTTSSHTGTESPEATSVYGILNAAKALENTDTCAAQILSPFGETITSAPITITGIARGKSFHHYKLEWGSAPIGNYQTIKKSTNKIFNGVLGTINVSQSSKVYLRLSVYNKHNEICGESITQVVLSNTAPAMSVEIPNGSIHHVATGHFDNDDIADYLVSARHHDDAGYPQGTLSVHLVLGSSLIAASTPANLDTITNKKWTIPYLYEQNSYGLPTLMHDMDGDGLDDILIANINYTGSTSLSGEVCIYLASSQSTWPDTLDTSAANYCIHENFANAHVGFFLKSLPDLDNDDIGELVLGSCLAPSPGSTSGYQALNLLYTGTRSQWSQNNILSQMPISTLSTSESTSYCDSSFFSTKYLTLGTQTLGDVNGDTVEDFLVINPVNDSQYTLLSPLQPGSDILLDTSLPTINYSSCDKPISFGEGSNTPYFTVLRTPTVGCTDEKRLLLLPPIDLTQDQSVAMLVNTIYLKSNKLNLGTPENRLKETATGDLNGDGETDYVVSDAIQNGTGIFHIFSGSSQLASTGFWQANTGFITSNKMRSSVIVDNLIAGASDDLLIYDDDGTSLNIYTFDNGFPDLYDNDEDGVTVSGGDCNDSNPFINPHIQEICDQIDNNCDGQVDDVVTTYYLDADADNYGITTQTVQANCTLPAGYATFPDDCDDTRSNVNPGYHEFCDGRDNDCNGLIDDRELRTYYRDDDNDNYGNPNGSIQASCPPTGYKSNDDDCIDTNAAINPGASEICDDTDNNCDGSVDEGCT